MTNLITDLEKKLDSHNPLDSSIGEEPQRSFHLEIGDYISLLSSQYDLEKMILYCKEFVQILVKLNSYSSLDEHFKDSSALLKDFIPRNIEKILACKDFGCAELEEIFHESLEQTVWLWLKVRVGEYPELDHIIRNILCFKQPFYKNTLHVKKAAEYLTWSISDYGTWTETLEPGDLIDCVKADPISKTKCWSHAKILEINESIFKVSFLNDHENTIKDIDKASSHYEIAPFKTKCQGLEWRMSLEKGDEIDVCDSFFMWYQATVLDTRETTLIDGSNVKELFIGYRLFREDGLRKDAEGRNFDGWSSRYDEWISATSSRISKIKTIARKMDIWNNWPEDEPLICDSSDLIYPFNSYKRKVYALERQEVTKDQSSFLVNLINRFGQKGGFEHIYSQITNKKTWEDFKAIGYLCSIVKNMSYFFHREFALEYIPKLETAIWENITLLSGANIKDIEGKSLEYILSAFETLLLRVYSVGEKIEAVDKLRYEICRCCFESPKPEIRYAGLTLIYKIIDILKQNNIRQGSYAKDARNAFHEFLVQNNIYAKTFLSKENDLVLESSSGLLEYCLFKSELIALSDLEKAWANLVESNSADKDAFHEMLLKNLSPAKHGPFFKFVALHLSEISPQQVTIHELFFVDRLFRSLLSSDSSNSITERYLSFYWKVSIDDGYGDTISEHAILKLTDFLQHSFFAPNRNLFLAKCRKNIRQGISVLRSTEVARRLMGCSLKLIPAANHQPSNQTHLCQDEQLLGLLINELKCFKKTVAEKVKDMPNILPEQLDLMIDDHIPFKTHIYERVTLIERLLLCGYNHKYQITYELLEDLWTTLVQTSLIAAEVEIAVNVLKNILRSKKASTFSYEDIIKFCNEKLESKELRNHITDSWSGFEFYREIFVLVNENKKSISEINLITDKEADFPCRFEKLIRESNPFSAKDEFKFRVNVWPGQLRGIQTVWDLMFETKETDFFDKVTDFLVRLYTRVNMDCGVNKKDTIREYVDKCYSILKDTLENKSQFSEEIFTEKIVKCEKLIIAVMDKTEKYDDITNHHLQSALANSSLLQIIIENDLGRIQIETNNNNTMYHLFSEVAKIYKIPQKEVHLRNKKTSAVYRQTGVTLFDLGIENSEVLIFTHIVSPKAVLAKDDGTLNPKASKIFTKWFEENSNNGKMDPDQLALFIQSCADNCTAEDRRVKDVFFAYDTGRCGYLTLQNFMEFYQRACTSRVSVVWSNLKVLGERSDLKEPRKQKSKQVDLSLSVRHIVSSDRQFLSLLFSLRQFEGEIGCKTQELLNRLPKH